MSRGKKIGLGVGGGLFALLALGALAPEAPEDINADAPEVTAAPSQESAAQPSDEPVDEAPAVDPDAEAPAADAPASSAPVVQAFTQPGENPDIDLAFTVSARMSPSIDADKGWSDPRILTLGGEAARMWENGASTDEIVSYLQSNGMTALTSHYFTGLAISTYCSTDAIARYGN